MSFVIDDQDSDRVARLKLIYLFPFALMRCALICVRLAFLEYEELIHEAWMIIRRGNTCRPPAEDVSE